MMSGKQIRGTRHNRLLRGMAISSLLPIRYFAGTQLAVSMDEPGPIPVDWHLYSFLRSKAMAEAKKSKSTAAKKLKNTAKSVKSVVKKMAKKVDKAVVEPIAKMIGASSKSPKKKTTKSKTPRAKQAKKK